jgi:hypothetical protein
MSPTKTVPHPTKSYTIEQQERFVDALLKSLHLQPRDDQQDNFIVHIMLDGAGIRVLALPDDPVARADELGDEWLTAFWVAGTDHEERPRLVQMATQRICDLLAIVEEFEPSQELTKRWKEGRFPDADSYARELSSAQ